MVAAKDKIDLIAIVGPTASGKSALAMKVAKEYNGEIIAADSRTIYKGMNIGTAKPSESDQTVIRHWGLDLIEPGQVYSAAKFKDYALKAIDDIQSRGKLPVLVGGTGLYIDAVLFNFEFPKGADQKLRDKLDKLSVEHLQNIIEEKGYEMPVNRLNKRHLARTIEREGSQGGRASSLLPNTLLIGLMQSDEDIKEAIEKRTVLIFNGLIKETTLLIKQYGRPALTETGGIAYGAATQLLEGSISENEAKELIQQQEWQYARRQKTWFRRNKFIHWYHNGEQAFTSVSQTLNNQIGT